MDKVLKADHFIFEIVHHDLVVLNDTGDLEFLDAITNGDQLASAPQEAVHFNRANVLLELGHVRLVIPRFDVEDDVGLGDHLALLVLLGRLARVVSGDTLSLVSVF